MVKNGNTKNGAAPDKKNHKSQKRVKKVTPVPHTHWTDWFKQYHRERQRLPR